MREQSNCAPAPRSARKSTRHPSPLLSGQEPSIVVFVASPAATTVIIAIIIVVIVVIPTPLPRSIPGDHALFHGRAARSLPDRRAGCRADTGSDHSAVPAA